jgi:hypothetical protein
MIISACGYDRKSLELTPLAQQLEQQGLLESKDLYFNTAGTLQSAAESAIPGMAVKGRHVAEALVKDLPARPLPPQAERPERLGADWANGYSRESFEGFVRYRGLAPNWVESQGGPQDAPEFHFPDPERFLRQLAQRPPEQLSPSEKITLQRAHQLRLRMGNPEI